MTTASSPSLELKLASDIKEYVLFSSSQYCPDNAKKLKTIVQNSGIIGTLYLRPTYGHLQTYGDRNDVWTKQVVSFVYDTLTSSTCRQTLGASNPEPVLFHKNCIKGLSNLPLTEGDVYMYVDGDTLGCRALYGVFATQNPNRCAHLSLRPTEDPNGSIKCKDSAQKDPLDFFTKAEIAKIFDVCEDDPDLDGDTCFKILEEEKEPKQFKKERKRSPMLARRAKFLEQAIRHLSGENGKE